MNDSKNRKAIKQYFGQGADRSVWGQKRALKITYVRESHQPGPVTVIKPNDKSKTKS